MPHPIQFTRFEIEQRKHSPNAVIGFYNGFGDLTGARLEKRMFIMAPGASLGKHLGDKLADTIKAALEREYLQPALRIRPMEAQQIECPDCKHLQTYSFPMSGKLYCCGCGGLLDQITGDDGSIGEELLHPEDDLERKMYAVHKSIIDGTFTRAEALTAYDVTSVEYEKYLKQQQP